MAGTGDEYMKKAKDSVDAPDVQGRTVKGHHYRMQLRAPNDD